MDHCRFLANDLELCFRPVLLPRLSRSIGASSAGGSPAISGSAEDEDPSQWMQDEVGGGADAEAPQGLGGLAREEAEGHGADATGTRGIRRRVLVQHAAARSGVSADHEGVDDGATGEDPEEDAQEREGVDVGFDHGSQEGEACEGEGYPGKGDGLEGAGEAQYAIALLEQVVPCSLCVPGRRDKESAAARWVLNKGPRGGRQAA